MKLSLRLLFSVQAQPQGLHGGHHHEILCPDHGGLSPIITPLNPAVVPAVSYEYLFDLPSSERLRPLARRKVWGLLLGSCTSGIVGHLLQPKNLDTVHFH
jgi:hypothetical protein